MSIVVRYINKYKYKLIITGLYVQSTRWLHHQTRENKFDGRIKASSTGAEEDAVIWDNENLSFGWNWQMSTLGLESVFVGDVGHGVGLAVVGVEVAEGAAYSENSLARSGSPGVHQGRLLAGLTVAELVAVAVAVQADVVRGLLAHYGGAEVGIRADYGTGDWHCGRWCYETFVVLLLLLMRVVVLVLVRVLRQKSGHGDAHEGC